MSKYGNYTMRYDELGNPISYKGYSMVWTKGRQLAALSDTQTTMAFKYDNNGIRTLKRVNGVDTEFTYAGTTLISQKTGNEIINFAYTAGGAPYGFTYNGTSYFYLLNLQGDIIGIYDSNGDVVVKYAYDSWGQLMSITGTLADTIGVKNPLRYRGYYYDTETKLYYLQSRYYDPETCHFISMDSYFIAGDYINGMNMYAYCLNNPVMYSDPSGYATSSVKPAYEKDTSHPAIFFVCLLSSWIIMDQALGMTALEIIELTLEVGDAGDLVYVAEVMYNGKVKGTYTDSPYINGREIYVCKAFTNKKVCKEVAKWYTWIGEGNTEQDIAQEIYGHAMAYFYYGNVKNLIGEDLTEEILIHSNPVNLGGTRIVDKLLVNAYNLIWYTSFGSEGGI